MPTIRLVAARTGALLTLWLCATTLLTLAAPAGASAASTGVQYGSIGQYGQAFRGGGFDACWFDNDNYDGQGFANHVSGCTANESQPAAGKFVDPVGFAVDTDDPDPSGAATAIYVLDRTSDLPANVSSADGDSAAGVTTWRLQKLSVSAGGQLTVLGQDAFSLPADTPAVTGDGGGANGNTVTNLEMFGLAVDPAEGRVYALMVGHDADTGNEVVNEILSWSTTQNGSGQLPAANGLAADTLAAGTGGDPTPAELSGLFKPGTQFDGGSDDDTAGPLLVSASSSLPFAGEPYIQSPEGIAIGSSDDIVVQGLDATSSQAGAGLVAVSPTGTVAKTWSSQQFAPTGFGSAIPNDADSEVSPAAGLSTNPVNGNLTWLDDEQNGGPYQGADSDFDIASIAGNLGGTPTMLSSAVNAPTEGDGTTLAVDGAAVSALDLPPESTDDGSPVAATQTSGPQIVALSNGLYASVFAPDKAGTVDPQNPAGADGLWTGANPGIRLLSVDAFGYLSESTPPLSTLFDTLGGQAGTACSIDDATSAATGAEPWPALAAGSNGAIWVLTSGQDSSGRGAGVTGDISNPETFEGGRQLIELTPGGASPCATPSGSFQMSAAGQTVTAGQQTLNVTAGTTVDFDASTIAYHGGAVNGYGWTFGNGATATNVTGAGGAHQWPATTTSETFTAPGDYTVSLDVDGDFGQYIETGQVDVTSATPPVAAFAEAPASPQAGQQVSFDASASTPSSIGGATITTYEWDFGDGTTDSTSSPTDTHTYASAGTYAVTLTVLDSAGQHATISQTVTVAAAPVTTTTQTITQASGPPSNSFSLAHASATRGTVHVPVTVADAGRLVVRATFTEKVKVKGKHKTKTVTKTLTFGSSTVSVSSGTSVVTLTPSGAARSVLLKLASSASLTVELTITFTPTGGSSATHTESASVKGLLTKKRKR